MPKQPIDFKEVKLKFKNYLNAYEWTAGDGVLDCDQCEKAIDNRLRYLNLKIKDEDFLYKDLNIKTILYLENYITELEEHIVWCVEKLKSKNT